VTGTGSYPGASPAFSGSSAQAQTSSNLTALCPGGKPQKTIKVVSGTDFVG
jgi:hypothetical protein